MQYLKNITASFAIGNQIKQILEELSGDPVPDNSSDVASNNTDSIPVQPAGYYGNGSYVNLMRRFKRLKKKKVEEI